MFLSEDLTVELKVFFYVLLAGDAALHKVKVFSYGCNRQNALFTASHVDPYEVTHFYDFY